MSDIIGSGDDAQIFEQGIPQGATGRFVVYQLFGGQNFEHLYGEAGLGQTRFQIDCYGDCESDAA